MSRKHVHALRPDRMWNRRPAPNPLTPMERHEGIVAYLDGDLPAKPTSPYDLNALHAEALVMNDHACIDRDCSLPVWECVLVNDASLTDPWGIDWEDDPWQGESMYQQDEVYFEGLDECPNMYSDDHWLRYARTMDEVRDIFGGTDFVIIHSFRA